MESEQSTVLKYYTENEFKLSYVTFKGQRTGLTCIKETDAGSTGQRIFLESEMPPKEIPWEADGTMPLEVCKKQLEKHFLKHCKDIQALPRGLLKDLGLLSLFV